MVSTTNVKALLLRLHQETQTGSAVASTTGTLLSFASSLGQAIIAEDGAKQGTDDFPLPAEADGKVGTGRKKMTSPEETGGDPVDVEVVSPGLPQPKSYVAFEANVNVAVRGVDKSSAHREAVLATHGHKDVDEPVVAVEEAKPASKTGKDKAQKIGGADNEVNPLSATTSAATVVVETLAQLPAGMLAPAVVPNGKPEQGESQLSTDGRSHTAATQARGVVVPRVQAQGSRLPADQKTGHVAKEDMAATKEEQEGISEAHPSLEDSPSFHAQVSGATKVESGTLVQSVTQSMNIHVQPAPIAEAKPATTAGSAGIGRSETGLIMSPQSSDSLDQEAKVRFQPGIGLGGNGERIIAATPLSLEVGLPHETHGLLKIRAETTDTGAVAATLASSSTSGEQMLHRELPALSSFLNSEQLSLSSISVHSSSEASGLFSGMDGGCGGAGGQAWNGSDGSQDGSQSGGAGTGFNVALPSEEAFEDLHDVWGSAGSGWISVRA